MKDSRKSRRPTPAPGRALLARLQRRAEDDRYRLARVLHHDVSGMLAAARMDLSRFIARLDGHGDLAEQLGRVDQLLAQVISDAQAEMQRQHPALLDHFGLPVALRHLIDETCRTRGGVFTLEFVDESAGLEPPLPIAVYRSVQAILAASPVQELTATFGPRRDGYALELEVRPAPEVEACLADDLHALRAWLEDLGATWKESRCDQRWVIELRLPRRAATAPCDGPGA